MKYPDVYQTADGSIEDAIVKYQNEMKAENKNKNKTIEFCLQKLTDAERQAERDAIGKIDEYRKKEKHIYRAIEKQRRNENEIMPEYGDKENELISMIDVLKGELFDIEINLQNALKASRDKLFANIKTKIGNMKDITETLFGNVGVETSNFNDRLKEECEKEKQNFLARIENNEDQEQILSDYAEEARENIVDLMISEDREVLSELLTHFKEQIDAKIQEIESNISKNLN